MPRGTAKKALAPVIGGRVQIPAYTDMWMRGARFGVVERVQFKRLGVAPHKDLFGVRLDHPQANKRLYWFVGDDCTHARGEGT